jgi:beta-glucosidase
LPFDKSKTIAVIGPNAKVTTYCGGGSASLAPYYTVSPFEGVSAKSTADVEFAQGVYAHQNLPLLGEWLRTADGKAGFSFKVYNEAAESSTRTCIDELHLTSSMMFFMDYVNPKLGPVWYADMEGIYTPDASGLYDFGLSVSGTARLFVDDKLVVDNTTDQKAGSSFFGTGTEEVIGAIELDAGRDYKITIKWGCAATSSLQQSGIISFGPGGCRFGACKRAPPKDSIADAVKLASKVDQVVVFAGLNQDWETEGHDRDTMDLPPNSDELIAAVLVANPKAVIVIQSGTPVTMPWADQANAIVQAWYGGNETGNGIADVLYGDVNPVCSLIQS